MWNVSSWRNKSVFFFSISLQRICCIPAPRRRRGDTRRKDLFRVLILILWTWNAQVSLYKLKEKLHVLHGNPSIVHWKLNWFETLDILLQQSSFLHHWNLTVLPPSLRPPLCVALSLFPWWQGCQIRRTVTLVAAWETSSKWLLYSRCCKDTLITEPLTRWWVWGAAHPPDHLFVCGFVSQVATRSPRCSVTLRQWCCVSAAPPSSASPRGAKPVWQKVQTCFFFLSPSSDWKLCTRALLLLSVSRPWCEQRACDEIWC